MAHKNTLTYKAAGVDIDAGEALVERIREPVKQTSRPEVVGGIGGFGGLFRVPPGYRSPILVAGTDGVGTKLKLAIDHDAHDEIGIDLVAMCVNDVVVQGAEPLFFLDYYVTPRLDVDVAARVITGVARGCEIAGAALIGGETAEHPGMHAAGEYDLAGFCVGIVEEARIVDGSTIVAGDSLLGVASSGPHSNGFSLIRRVLEQQGGNQNARERKSLIAQLLKPTRIYVRPVLNLCKQDLVKGLAHITGGGLTENIPRVLPAGLGVRLRASSWPRLRVFQWLAGAGVGDEELYRTFNCGIGMIVIVERGAEKSVLEQLEADGEQAWVVGEVVEDSGERVEIT